MPCYKCLNKLFRSRFSFLRENSVCLLSNGLWYFVCDNIGVFLFQSIRRVMRMSDRRMWKVKLNDYDYRRFRGFLLLFGDSGGGTLFGRSSCLLLSSIFFPYFRGRFFFSSIQVFQAVQEKSLQQSWSAKKQKKCLCFHITHIIIIYYYPYWFRVKVDLCQDKLKGFL